MGVKLDASERILKVWKRTHSCHLDIDDYVVPKISKAMWFVVVPVPYCSVRSPKKGCNVIATPKKGDLANTSAVEIECCSK